MLASLTIKNVALIDSAEIEFGEGLNVLSGETGAGKSVILDSVNFVLGAKADKSMIRYGEEECFVKATFLVDENSLAYKALEDIDIEPDECIIISRKYNLNGKGTIKINGNAVNATMLKKVTSALVDVHGQSEHFFLLSEKNQLNVLDGICPPALDKAKAELREEESAYRDIKKRLSVFSGDKAERARRIDMLNFQITEIDDAALKEGEEEELREKLEKVRNAEKIARAIGEAESCLTAENGALDLIKSAKRSVSSVSKFDGEYLSLSDRLENAIAEIDDIGESLSFLSDGLFVDEREAEAMDSRLDFIKELKRKYGGSVAEIIAFREKANAEYEMLSNCDEEFSRLESERKESLKKIYSICLRLTALRKEAAEKFSKRVISELASLNIPKADFAVEFTPYTEDNTSSAGEDGLDDICFMFSANAGEPLKPLGKIISGGEMSRFMLSVKSQLSGINGISTYIFDEIDTGVSGKTARVMAEKIAKIAMGTQVIAVSHLPQLVSMGDTQIFIEKKEEGGKTYTKVKRLEGEDRIKEIARLLGGEEGSKYALDHAREMYESSNSYKKSL